MNIQEFQNFVDKEVKKRYIKAPLMNAARVLRLVYFQFTEDHRLLKSLKNKYEGERCFIVGNGPSLRIEDLNKLQNEHCFGFNRIYEVYDNTAWRPEFHMVLDNDVMKEVIENQDKLDSKYRLLNIMGKAKGAIRTNGTIFFCSYGLYRPKEFGFVKKKISRDISKYISLNFSVTSAAIEVAMYMGFKEIYIIGLDNNFSRWIDKKGEIHFQDVNDYNLMKAHTFNYFSYQDAVNSCFECYRKEADKRGIKIINLTRGGHLDAFERGIFEDII